ncbi:MAG: YqgE/AlgH family protein [Alphaproteobacteria bacterium]|nr:YqgE/AlgH family protein [Alphaproteobacteria bacterium]
MKSMITKQTTEKNKPNAALLVGDGPLRNQLLVAMPGLKADAFSRSVIYICAHSPAGAMGIVVNQKLQEVKFKDLLEQLQLPHSELQVDPVVHFGGPVETGRGFVLHSTDFMREDTVKVNDHIGITGTVDILRAIAEGAGPHKSIFALGYAGWGPGQLDAEMQANGWLVAPPDDDLIFNPDLSSTWEKAMLKMGIDPVALSSEPGHS